MLCTWTKVSCSWLKLLKTWRTLTTALIFEPKRKSTVFFYLLLNKNAASFLHTGESITHGKVVWVIFNCQITNITLTSLIKPKAKQPRHRTQDVYIHQPVEQLREFWDDYKEDLNIPQHRPALSLAATQLLQVHRDHRRNDPWHKSVPNPNCLQVAPGPRQTSVRFISSCQCRARCFEEYISMDIE